MKPQRAWLVAVVIAALGAVPALRAEDAPAPSARGHNAEQLRERLERLRERAAALASTLPSASAAPPPVASAFELPASSAELAKRWAAHAATRRERQARHRAQLLGEVGGQLDNPAALAELKLHAQRLAELGRIEFLAQNARQGTSRAQLLSRVARLRARELERHQKRLIALTGHATPGLSASAAAPAPAPSTRREAGP
jgi:hypothetical protein